MPLFAPVTMKMRPDRSGMSSSLQPLPMAGDLSPPWPDARAGRGGSSSAMHRSRASAVRSIHAHRGRHGLQVGWGELAMREDEANRVLARRGLASPLLLP